jgi:leucyl-tRNA---protein transferase
VSVSASQDPSVPVKAQVVKVFVSLEHPCGYYPNRHAQNLVLDPIADGQKEIYDSAIAKGFRRGGGNIYRPHCAKCNACVASRINVQNFRPNRSQRRCLTANKDIEITTKPAVFSAEYFDLYQRYLAARHVDGGMDDPNEADFSRFLLSSWSQTEFIEFRMYGRLLSVAVTDVTPSGLSAVYCFFDPSEAARSLGTFAILSQIELARAAGLAAVYLGFWIDGHEKMHYKSKFSGLEVLRSGEWRAGPKC